MFAGGSRTFWLGLGAENEVHSARSAHKNKNTEPCSHFTVVKKTEGGTSRAFFGQFSRPV